MSRGDPPESDPLWDDLPAARCRVRAASGGDRARPTGRFRPGTPSTIAQAGARRSAEWRRRGLCRPAGAEPATRGGKSGASRVGLRAADPGGQRGHSRRSRRRPGGAGPARRLGRGRGRPGDGLVGRALLLHAEGRAQPAGLRLLPRRSAGLAVRGPDRAARCRPRSHRRLRVPGRVSALRLGVQPAGFGDLALRFEALKAKLAAEGLFDSARKRPLPLSAGCHRRGDQRHRRRLARHLPGHRPALAAGAAGPLPVPGPGRRSRRERRRRPGPAGPLGRAVRAPRARPETPRRS